MSSLKPTGFINNENINESGIWSLGLLQMDFFYRKRRWYAGQFVRKVIPKIEVTGFKNYKLTKEGLNAVERLQNKNGKRLE